MPELDQSRSSLMSRISVLSDSDPDLKKRKLTRALSQLVIYIKGKSSKKMEILVDRLKYDQLYSFTDRKAFGFIQKQRHVYVNMTKDKLIRVYPSILRVNSSNFDPLPFWLAGTQMTALNFQTYGIYN